jgi:trimeric autotransporter adhesin
MKHLIFFLVVLLISNTNSTAQSFSINNDGSIANASAILDVKSTSKGILVSRMSALQRNAIASPANGLLLYDIDSLAFTYYNGTKWVFIKSGSDTSNSWSINGNDNTNASTNFIGTTNANDLIFKIDNTKAGYIRLNSNAAFGYNAGNIGAGTSNTAIGAYNSTSTMTGSFNTGVGAQTFNLATSGSNNTGVGYYNLRSGITGNHNTAFGVQNIEYTTGSYNIAIGNLNLARTFRAGQNYNKNIAIGFTALNNQSYGFNNIAIGEAALNKDTTSFNNIAIGSKALFNNANRNNLIAIGDSALFNNGIGALSSFESFGNIAIGSKVLYTNNVGFNNTAIGYQSMQLNTTGFNNVANGMSTLRSNTTGGNNTAIGYRALLGNLTGSSNIAIGSFTMQNHRLKDNNVAIGQFSMSNDTTGISNVAIGFNSLLNNRKGAYNTGIGTSSLQNNIIGTNNTGLGYLANVSSDSIGNATSIGALAYVSQSNSLVLGSIAGTNGATDDTKVGIGVTNPAEKLEIGNGRLKFRGNLTNGDAHGIAFTDNAGTLERAFIGMENDDMFGIYNLAFGWNVRVHNATGEVGINKQPSNNILDSRLQVKQIVGGQNGIGIEAASSNNHWDWYVNTSNDLSMFYNGIIRGTYNSATGAYVSVSDKRLKKNISLLPTVLNNIKKIEAFNYHYIDNKITDNLSNGFMAQDVQKIFPNAVFESDLKNGEKRLGINYQYFTVLAIKGIQEQQQQIELQDKKITDLQLQIDEIKHLLKKN